MEEQALHATRRLNLAVAALAALALAFFAGEALGYTHAVLDDEPETLAMRGNFKGDIVLASATSAPAEGDGVVVETMPLADDPHRLALVVLDGVQRGQWGLVVSAVLVGLIFVLRRFGKQLVPALAGFLDHPIVAWALPSTASILGAVVTALVAGTPVSVGLVLSAVITGLTANGLFNGLKQVQEAKAAGQAAAANVDTKAEALNVLKGPKP